MASQQQGKNVDAAVVVDGDGESSTGESSPDRVLPLDALKSLVPECKDDHQDIPACAWDTINDCITKATVRLAFVSANNATAKGKRKVITAEDVTRAIEGLNEKDAGLGMVILEMSAVVAEKKRAAAASAEAPSGAGHETEGQGGGGGGRGGGGGGGVGGVAHRRRFAILELACKVLDVL